MRLLCTNGIDFDETDINREPNKKHSEKADTSTSVTFDLELWPWLMVKNAYVIRCRLLYCTLVPGMMYVSVKVCEIWPQFNFLFPLTFACDLHHPYFYH